MSDDNDIEDDDADDEDKGDIDAEEMAKIIINGDKHKIIIETMEENHPIPEKFMTKEIVASSISMLARIGYGLTHAFIKLQCIDKSITDISILAQYRNLRFITLSHNLISDLSPLSKISQLMYLKADNNRVSEGGQIKPLDCLQFFDLSHNNLISPAGFTHKRLKHFVLNQNMITSLVGGGCSPPISHLQLPSLRILELRGNQLTSTAGLTRLARLHTLYAGENLITSLEHLCFMSGLKRLHLRDNHLKSLNGLGDELFNLEYLNLRGNEIKRFREVRKLAVLSMLKILVLSDNPIAEHEEYRTVVLGIMPYLERLDKEKTSKAEIAEAVALMETREEAEFQEENDDIDVAAKIDEGEENEEDAGGEDTAKPDEDGPEEDEDE